MSMKYILCAMVFVVFACKRQVSHADVASAADTNKQMMINKPDKSKYYTSKDTLRITNEIGDTFIYTKQQFNQLVDNHPELTDEFTEEPDRVYYRFGNNAEFGSEVGQDKYYELYAYFLKQKNGVGKYDAQRKKLIDIYIAINALFQRLQYGGTYFGHQYARLLGYAEYSVYLYKEAEEERFYKTYDVAKEKKLYIESLRQLVRDEEQIDVENSPSEKAVRSKELNGMVDELDKAITSIFYLRSAQEFHYHYYSYY